MLYLVSIPANLTATVYLPAPSVASSVTEGGKPASQVSGYAFCFFAPDGKPQTASAVALR